MIATEDELRALLVDAICAALGTTYEDLYRHKSEWNADRGRRHDINFPFRGDIDGAADQIVALVLDAGWGPLTGR